MGVTSTEGEFYHNIDASPQPLAGREKAQFIIRFVLGGRGGGTSGLVGR